MTLDHVRLAAGQTASAVLAGRRGRYLLLNVDVGGRPTSVCVNVTAGGATWRDRQADRTRPLDLAAPPFALTGRTLVLGYRDANVLANNFHDVGAAVPPAARNDAGEVSVGKVGQGTPAMRDLLAALEGRTDAVLAALDGLALGLATRLSGLYGSLGSKRCDPLAAGGGLTEFGRSVLGAFGEARAVYARLPALTGFGTGNKRAAGEPNKCDARLRYYLQEHRRRCPGAGNPLAAGVPLDFVDYELKPLNISDSLGWKDGFPRTESVDLLMAVRGSPVLCEVKMAGDKFVSAAVVQLLYYAAVLANGRQQARLRREFPGLTADGCWLGVVAQERDESKAGERGFSADLHQAVQFLRHAETRAVLGPFFSGAVVLVVREQPEPATPGGPAPAFRVAAGGEHVIDWGR